MANHEVVFHRLAQREYLSTRRRYASQQSDALAQSFQDELDRVTGLISADPEHGQTYGSRYRWIRLRRFPYVVYYFQVNEWQILVLAVAHSRRRPGYWRGRAPT